MRTASATGVAMVVFALAVASGAAEPGGAKVVANRFVSAANHGDYATVCRLYSRRYLKITRAECAELYAWAENFYGPFDYRIVGQRRLSSGRWHVELIRWRHPSFIELARERLGWKIVAGGW